MDVDFISANDDTAYAAQTTTYTGTAGTVTGFKPGPKGVLVWCTTDAYVRVGETGTAATVANTPVPAYTPVIFKVPVTGTGALWTVSAIQIASGGSVYAKPVN